VLLLLLLLLLLIPLFPSIHSHRIHHDLSVGS
jgi:hypothetical protein